MTENFKEILCLKKENREYGSHNIKNFNQVFSSQTRTLLGRQLNLQLWGHPLTEVGWLLYLKRNIISQLRKFFSTYSKKNSHWRLTIEDKNDKQCWLPFFQGIYLVKEDYYFLNLLWYCHFDWDSYSMFMGGMSNNFV